MRNTRQYLFSLTRPYRNVHCTRAAGREIRRAGEAAGANGCIHMGSRWAVVADGRTGLDSRHRRVAGDSSDCAVDPVSIHSSATLRMAWERRQSKRTGTAAGDKTAEVEGTRGRTRMAGSKT